VNLRAADVLEDLRPLGCRSRGCARNDLRGRVHRLAGEVAGRLFVLSPATTSMPTTSCRTSSLAAPGVSSCGVRRSPCRCPGCRALRRRRAAVRAAGHRPRALCRSVRASSPFTARTASDDEGLDGGGARLSWHGPRTRAISTTTSGVPLTILSRRGDEEFLVAEAGANDFGELDLLSRILEPMSSSSRTSGARTSRSSVRRRCAARQVGALRRAAPDGIAVLPFDDPYFETAGRSRAAPGAHGELRFGPEPTSGSSPARRCCRSTSACCCGIHCDPRQADQPAALELVWWRMLIVVVVLLAWHRCGGAARHPAAHAGRVRRHRRRRGAALAHLLRRDQACECIGAATTMAVHRCSWP